MDPCGKMNLGKLTDQLQEYLTKFGNGLGLLDEEDKGARGMSYVTVIKYTEPPGYSRLRLYIVTLNVFQKSVTLSGVWH